MTMTLVSTVEVGSGGAASIEWTSIPQTGTDLLVALSGRNTSASSDGSILFNGSSASFTQRYLRGINTTVASGSRTTNTVEALAEDSGMTANTFNSAQIYVPNYSAATNKSFSVESVNENNAAAAYLAITAGLWSNTSAITSITLTTTGNWAQYSTASLYTITKGSGGATVS